MYLAGWKDFLPVDEVHARCRPEGKTIFQLIWIALQDKVLIILNIAAVISLALGLYTTLGTPPKSYTDSNGNLVTEPQVIIIH
ncbi:hypothetical protein PGTUg99_032404 [Puccinia graminis f. sp. tritici]|uniref:Cation-transporting P-type ATPase N-terminal domain-containing protein n=1 Tax=Puccinia graminis f. sp. tritici TaxID=56615 RepID=A0A5B0S8Q4_PUCGR|nr:hypothetical protein PGTUg99_032404 [Puccinia graminis f. sp. tritici]